MQRFSLIFLNKYRNAGCLPAPEIGKNISYSPKNKIEKNFKNGKLFLQVYSIYI